MGARRKIFTVGLGLNLAWAGGCKQQYPALAPQRLDFSDGRASDSLQTTLWKDYLQGKKLLEAWSPVPGSPWTPYVKPTLFSALDEIGARARPVYSPEEQAAEKQARHFARHEKIPADTMVMVDLPGEQTVAWGMALAREQGLQPVTTFNNWPHQRGVLKAERILGALIYYAAEMAQGKRDGKIGREARPVFLLDANRLGVTKTIKDSDFDNRYYLLASDLPSGAQLKAAGIKHVLYVVPYDSVQQEQDDLNSYFTDLQGDGVDFAIISAQKYTDESQVIAAKQAREREASVRSTHSYFPWWYFFHSGRGYQPAYRPTILSTGRGASQFKRRSAGGFGGYHGIASEEKSYSGGGG